MNEPLTDLDRIYLQSLRAILEGMQAHFRKRNIDHKTYASFQHVINNIDDELKRIRNVRLPTAAHDSIETSSVSTVPLD